MNGYPKIDPQVAQRTERTIRAREHVKIWTNFMKANGLPACLFSMVNPMDNEFSLLVGAMDHELSEAGYVIASHSHTVISQQNGVFIGHLSFVVRAKAEAPKVLLA